MLRKVSSPPSPLGEKLVHRVPAVFCLDSLTVRWFPFITRAEKPMLRKVSSPPSPLGEKLVHRVPAVFCLDSLTVRWFPFITQAEKPMLHKVSSPPSPLGEKLVHRGPCSILFGFPNGSLVPIYNPGRVTNVA